MRVPERQGRSRRDLAGKARLVEEERGMFRSGLAGMVSRGTVRLVPSR